MDIQPFLDDVVSWARRADGVAGVALCGSHATGTAGPDSDIDLIILCHDLTAFLDDRRWLGTFGETRTIELEHYGKVTSLRTFYSDGMEVEFSLTDLDWTAIPLDTGTRSVIRDGFRILLDPEKLFYRAFRNITRN